MRSASYHHSSYASHSPRSRSASAVLAIAFGLGLFLLLLTMGVLPDRLTDSNVLATFDVRPKAETDTRSAPKAAARATPTPRPVDPPPVTAPPPTPAIFPDMIILSSRDFAAADIGSIRRSPRGGGTDGAAATADSGSGNSAIGAGPDGQPMYNAAWYREPTRAEMATYMPKRRPEDGAKGVIICRMVGQYRVEDCREAGGTPGSGLAGTMRQAAWQFLIRPPRVGNTSLVGVWVRITFTFHEAKE